MCWEQKSANVFNFEMKAMNKQESCHFIYSENLVDRICWVRWPFLRNFIYSNLDLVFVRISERINGQNIKRVGRSSFIKQHNKKKMVYRKNVDISIALKRNKDKRGKRKKNIYQKLFIVHRENVRPSSIIHHRPNNCTVFVCTNAIAAWVCVSAYIEHELQLMHHRHHPSAIIK